MAFEASDIKKSLLHFKGKCSNACEAKLIVGEEETEVYVCKEQLVKLSEYFRVMFNSDFKEKNQNQFQINEETPEDLICFFIAIDPNSNGENIDDDSIELLMRLADKFQCDLLNERLKNYIDYHKNDRSKRASTILNWLICSLKFNMPESAVKMCWSGVGCLPYPVLYDNREKIGLDLFHTMIDAKFKVLYKAFDLHSKSTSNSVSYNYSCCKCNVNGGLLPYKFCKHTQNANRGSKPYCYSACLNCSVKPFCPSECDDHEYYYKCPSCNTNPVNYENKEQCFCARKNYEHLFSEVA